MFIFLKKKSLGILKLELAIYISTANIQFFWLQSLVISMMSYMGVIRVTLKTEKDFIDEQKLKSCIQGAFETILKATREIPVETK